LSVIAASSREFVGDLEFAALHHSHSDPEKSLPKINNYYIIGKKSKVEAQTPGFMRKWLLINIALALGTILTHAQGTITLNTIMGTVETNDGLSIGPARGTSWTYEVLDMTESQWLGLSAAEQAEAYNLSGGDPQAVSLWTDSGVSGTGPNLVTHAGGIVSVGDATAANWAAPTGLSYNTAPSYDYYTVLGWSANLGDWSAVDNALQGSNLSGEDGWFGQTGVAFNYAGGGPDGLAPVSVWSDSQVTGLSNSGMPDGDVAGDLVLYPLLPEPTTLALVGLGGISMLFLRRRKV
jgi:hypothetical protein